MYLKVIEDILEYYFKYITIEELVQLQIIVKDLKKDNNVTDDMVITINNILNKIWNKTLSDVNDFKNGDKFCFLVRNSTASDETLRKIGLGNAGFKILSNHNIENFSFGDDLLIIKPDYDGARRNEPLLPMYFENGTVSKNLNYKILSAICFDDKLENFSYTLKSTTKFSEDNNIPLIIVDKILYRKNKGLDIVNSGDIRNAAFAFYEKYNGNIRDIKRNQLMVDNKRVKNTISKFYYGKISLEKLEQQLNIIFDEIANNIDSLDNKNKKIL